MGPLYSEIAEILRRGIQDGDYGEQLPTEARLVERFAVSAPTIKKALSMLVADDIIVRIPGKGTFIKNPASAVSVAEPSAQQVTPVPATVSVTIGVILPRVADAFSSRLLSGIAAGLAERSAQLLLGVSENDRGKEGDFVGAFMRAGIQGLIIFPVEGELYNEDIVRLSLDRFPLVLLDRWLPGIDVSRVVGDHAGGAGQAVAYLRELGHTRIALVSVDSPHPFTTKSILERMKGYSEGIKAATLPVDDDLLWVHESGADAGSDAVIDFVVDKLRSYPDVTAVIAVSIYDARRLHEAATRLNRRIPDDLSLIGFDMGGQILGFEQLFAKGGEDNPVAWIDQSEHIIGLEAVRLVCRLTADERSTEAICVPAVLRPGATCAKYRDSCRA
jgi:GntR family transcriptional regulator of arabinose operon